MHYHGPRLSPGPRETCPRCIDSQAVPGILQYPPTDDDPTPAALDLARLAHTTSLSDVVAMMGGSILEVTQTVPASTGLCGCGEELMRDTETGEPVLHIGETPVCSGCYISGRVVEPS